MRPSPDPTGKPMKFPALAAWTGIVQTKLFVSLKFRD